MQAKGEYDVSYLKTKCETLFKSLIKCAEEYADQQNKIGALYRDRETLLSAIAKHAATARNKTVLSEDELFKCYGIAQQIHDSMMKRGVLGFFNESVRLYDECEPLRTTIKKYTQTINDLCNLFHRLATVYYSVPADDKTRKLIEVIFDENPDAVILLNMRIELMNMKRPAARQLPSFALSESNAAIFTPVSEAAISIV